MKFFLGFLVLLLILVSAPVRSTVPAAKQKIFEASIRPAIEAGFKEDFSHDDVILKRKLLSITLVYYEQAEDAELFMVHLRWSVYRTDSTETIIKGTAGQDLFFRFEDKKVDLLNSPEYWIHYEVFKQA